MKIYTRQYLIQWKLTSALNRVQKFRNRCHPASRNPIRYATTCDHVFCLFVCLFCFVFFLDRRGERHKRDMGREWSQAKDVIAQFIGNNFTFQSLIQSYIAFFKKIFFCKISSFSKTAKWLFTELCVCVRVIGCLIQKSCLWFFFVVRHLALSILQVRFDVKVGEKCQLSECVENHDPFCPSGVFTVVVEQRAHPRYYDNSKLSLQRQKQTSTKITTQNLRAIRHTICYL